MTQKIKLPLLDTSGATSGHVLTNSSGTPTWAAPASGGGGGTWGSITGTLASQTDLNAALAAKAPTASATFTGTTTVADLALSSSWSLKQGTSLGYTESYVGTATGTGTFIASTKDSATKLIIGGTLASNKVPITGPVSFSQTPYVTGTQPLWHSGNDGTGSGLDADLLDGLEATAFAQLTGATFSGAISATNGTFSGAVTTGSITPSGSLNVNAAGGALTLNSSSALGVSLQTGTTTRLYASASGVDVTGSLTATGLVSTPASTASIAGLRLPHGAAPTTPTNGDVWTTTAGMYARINGATVGPFGAGGGGGSSSWGGITGTLSSQTDLQAALDAKASTASPTFTGTISIGVSTIQAGSLQFGQGTIGVMQMGASSTNHNGILTTGGALVNQTYSGLGYTTGAGGTVTQATSRYVPVTINKPTGRITTYNASLAAGATAYFTVNNSAVAATDVVMLSSVGPTGDADLVFWTNVSNSGGSFILYIKNTGTAANSNGLSLNFAVIKGATS